MFIDRRQLAEIIAQEVREHLRGLVEGDDGEDPPRKKPLTVDAEKSPSPKGDAPPGPSVRDGDGTDSDAPDDADPSDDDALDTDGDAGEEPSGAIANDITGKSVQGISIEPDSKILPGAREVVLTFQESTDALHILVTPTGQMKFFWRGGLHDMP